MRVSVEATPPAPILTVASALAPAPTPPESASVRELPLDLVSAAAVRAPLAVIFALLPTLTSVL